MRVGVYLGTFSPDVGGGYTMQADLFSALCQAARNSNHSFVVYYYEAYSGPIVGASDLGGDVRLVRLSRPSVMLRAVSMLRRNSRLARQALRLRSQLDEAASADGVQVLWFFAGGAHEPTEIPYVSTVWDLQHRIQPWFPEVSNRGEWDLRESAHEVFLKRATFVATGTEEGRRQVMNYYHVTSDRVRVLPLPTPSFALDASTERDSEILGKYGLSQGYLFYPAQFWAHKNHINLLLALKKLKDSFQVIPTLVLCGSDKGNLSHVEANAAKLGLSSQIRILGFVDQSDLGALYRNALALTFVSYFGPDNLPPLEAFAVGCPVVASDVPGAREQLGDAALLVNPSDPDDIADGIMKIIQDPETRQALIELGLRRASRWTGGHYVRAMFSILDEFEAVRRCWSE